MQFKKLYLPCDAISRHADFEMWYEDGDLFLTAQSLNKEKPWSSESDRVALISRHGAEMGRIKPDNKCMDYYIRVERWEYTLFTYTLFKHYFVKGMLWDVKGSMHNVPLKIMNISTEKSDVRITRVKNFRDKGECFEIKVKDLSKLRVAAGAVIAIMLKEEYRGMSQGEPEDNKKIGKKLKRYFWQQGIPYEELVATGKIDPVD